MRVLVVIGWVLCSALSLAWGAPPTGVSVENKTVSAGGRSYRVQVVRVPLSSYRVKVGLAKGRVGATAPLASIAKQYGAVAAINGCFFDAYINDPVKPPWHHLFADGKMVYFGDTGTLLGFDAEGDYRMERLKVRLLGQVSGGRRPLDWYAYRVNYPMRSSSAAILYNRSWVGGSTPAGGTQVVVQDGKVTAVGPGSHSIPANGYVLAFVGSDSGLGSRFQVGSEVSYKATYEGPDPAFWEGVQEGMACGPRLLAQGALRYDPAGEGFSSPKILSQGGARSMVGITRDHVLLLVTASGTVRQMADVMKALGAYDAMNLDGGASSSLWANGSYLRSPGRNISNALLVVKK